MIRTTLEELGHSQTLTPVQVDNTTAHRFTNKTIKIERTKAIDMRYHWIIDRRKQGLYTVYLKPTGKTIADYHSKYHLPVRHRYM